MIERIGLKRTNAYLITNEDGRALLVDTGYPEEKEELKRALKSKLVVGIILTNGRVSHAANAKEIADKYKCDVFMHKFDSDLFNNSSARNLYAEGLRNKMKLKNVLKEIKDIVMPYPDNVHFVSETDDFTKLGFPNVKVVFLPGVTRGTIGILEGKKDLIVSDTLINGKKKIDSSEVYEEKASLINSLEKIKDIFPSKIYPSEGTEFDYEDYFKMEKIIKTNKK